MRWKLLTAFAAAFTAVFAFIAIWVVHYASDMAMQRLTAQLLEATEGAARDLPKKAVSTVTELPAEGRSKRTTAYQRLDEDLTSVQATIPSISPYTFMLQGDQLVYLVASDTPFKDPVARTAPEETLTYMREGLQGTTFEPQNTDSYGTWISAFSPIVDRQGNTIAAVGMDFSVEYVQDMQQRARSEVVPVLAVSYVLLILLVVFVSTLLVRPLRRLTAATGRIAEGDYDVDLDVSVRTRFPDEMSDLADSFAVMARKVAARERALSNEVRRLRVEIDATKREETVREITGTDFFTDLEAKAADLRSRMHKK